MFKWFGKQFLYGRIYLWAKERLSGLILALILLILVFYIHGEYLNYIEFKSENEANYIGISFVIKNTLILLIVLGYIYYYRKITQTQDSIKETKETIVKENKIDDKEKVSSLDQFLEDDEIDR